MALFKIYQGDSSRLPTEKHEGWVYVTLDKPAMYVDLIKRNVDGSVATGAALERIKLYDYVKSDIAEGTANTLAWYNGQNSITYSPSVVTNGTNLGIGTSSIGDIGSNKLYVNGTSNFNGNILANSNNTYNIGSSSQKWANVYATNFVGNATSASKVNNSLTIEGKEYNGSSSVQVGNTVYYITGNTSDSAGVWTGTDSRITSYYDGLTIIYVPKVAGASTTTLNLNNLGAKTCYYNGTSKLTTHYPAETPIMLTYINGYWKRADYNSNSDTKIRVYRQITSDSSYNLEYPLLISRTQASSIGTSGTNSSYSDVYGVMNNDTTKIPTVNVHTGTITAPLFQGIATNAETADKVKNTLTLKINSNTTEGTGVYTYNGSAAKSLQFISGDNVTLTPGAGTVTFSSPSLSVGYNGGANAASENNTTITGGLAVNGHTITVQKKTLVGGTGISIANPSNATGNITINHSNSITAKTGYTDESITHNTVNRTATFYNRDFKYDAQGHITASTDRSIVLKLSHLLGTSNIGSPTSPVYYVYNGETEVGDFTSCGYTFTNTSPLGSTSQTTIPTSKAVADAISSSFAANDAMVFKGTIGASGSGATITALPSTYSAGYTYKVISAGTYAGVKCEIGDLIIAIKDSSSSNSNSDWTVAQANIDGAIISTTDTGAVGGVLQPIYIDSNRVAQPFTQNLGSDIRPLYLNQGVLTQSSGQVGDSNKPIYMSNGSLTASNSNIGGTKQPIYMSAGVLTATLDDVGDNDKFLYMSKGILTESTKSLGSANKPIYLNAGTFTECSYSLNATLAQGTVNQIAWYNATNNVKSATNIITNGEALTIGSSSTDDLGGYKLHVTTGEATGNAVKIQGILQLNGNINFANGTTYYVDNNGNGVFNALNPAITNGGSLGTGGSTNPKRWKTLFIGTADSYGTTTKPIYWNEGVPAACNYELKATINDGTQYSIPFYNTATSLSTATNLYTNGTNLGVGVSINSNTSIPTTFYVNGTSRFNGAVQFANGSTYYVDSQGKAVFNTLGVGTITSTNINSYSIIPRADIAYTLGSSTIKWKNVYVGANTTYGSAVNPIYWNDGVPTACTYSLSATVGAASDGTNALANTIAWYNGQNSITYSAGIVTNGSRLGVGTSNQTKIGTATFYVYGSSDFEGNINLLTQSNQIKREGKSVTWIKGRDGAILRQTTYNGYNPILSVKTTDGDWSLGPYTSNYLYLSYCTDTNYTADSNTTTTQFIFKPSGELQSPYIGINGSDTTYKLYVNGTSWFNGNVKFEANSTHKGIAYFANGTSYYIDGSANFILNTGKVTKLGINTSASDTYVLNVNGTSYFGNTSYNQNIVPINSNTYTLGESTETSHKRWKAVYIGTADSYGANSDTSATPIYWNGGVPAPLTVTRGGIAQPIYLKDGVITACSGTVGDTNKPVYMSSGTITECSYSLNAQIASGTTNQLAWYNSSASITTGTKLVTNGTNLGIGTTAIADVGSNALYVSGTSNFNGNVTATKFIGPLQGNADTATILATARTIDGVSFNGSAAVTHYSTCSTEAATVEKVVSLDNFILVTGAKIAVKFTVTNTAASPTLNVNGTGAKAIYYRGSAISAGYLAANRIYEFVYDGTNYSIIGDINTDTNTKVTQSNTTTSNYRPIILGYNNSTDTSALTTTVTAQVYTASGVYVQPSTGALIATKVYNAVWNDYAECFPRGEETEPGDIIALDLDSNEEIYVKAIKDINKAIGVHSDSYGHLIGMDNEDTEEDIQKKFITIGLCGRVMVKVLDNPKKGDYIGPSSIPGVGEVCDSKHEAVGICVDANKINGKVKIKIL